MIESITLSGIASYGSAPEQLQALSQFNFLYGSNGTGKSTVGRVIAAESQFPTCQVTWKRGTKLQALVYNQDFVATNFNQSAELKGVFTLGEQHHDTLVKIDSAKAELDQLTEKISSLTLTLLGADGTGGKKAELSALEDGFKTTCWAQKQKHDAKLQGGFEGYRGSAEKFKLKVLHEQLSNKVEALVLHELEKKAESVFGPTPTQETRVPSVDTSSLLALETAPILEKRVIGKQDVDIAAMIEKLGNSDWVREGLGFYNKNDGVCPFCQQETSKAFAQSLNEYFDEAFAIDSNAIDDLIANYKAEVEKIDRQLTEIIESESRFLDVEKIKGGKQIFDARTSLNRQRLAGKKKEPSQVVALESIAHVREQIQSEIDAANSKVTEHNQMVSNISSEKEALTSQIWRFVLDELEADLAIFKTAKDGLEKAIAAISEKIDAEKLEKDAKAAEIRELERTTTSIQPTIDGINVLLRSFGFRNFKLAKAVTGTSYKLVREDGSDAMTTLSEGERSFVTFLYFYHLLKGSDSESGMTTERIVVFDDPVSSLDSDILFVVGSLIKALFDEIRSGTGHIRQIFVFTHNVYFHREVTYSSKRKKDVALKDETFWIVRKFGTVSKIDRHVTNPIKTSYELLWAEVRNPVKSNLTIQNTLRRILENYFKILGGFEFDQLCAMFEGKEKIVCKSLCSWVHDGSHYAHDDLYVTVDDAGVAANLEVFRAIFEKSHHGAHYKMMMGEAYEDVAAEAAAP